MIDSFWSFAGALTAAGLLLYSGFGFLRWLAG